MPEDDTIRTTSEYSIDSLITNLRIAVNPKELHTVVVTGCDEIEAIGRLTMEIASAFAREGNSKVVVVGCGHVDADSTNPLGASDSIGASAFADGRKTLSDDIPAMNNSRVVVIPFDGLDNSPAGIIADKDFLHFIDKLEEDYDYVVVAAPFANTAVDAPAVSQRADATVIAVELGTTRRAKLSRASEALKRAGGNVVGICTVEK